MGGFPMREVKVGVHSWHDKVKDRVVFVQFVNDPAPFWYAVYVALWISLFAFACLYFAFNTLVLLVRTTTTGGAAAAASAAAASAGVAAAAAGGVA